MFNTAIALVIGEVLSLHGEPQGRIVRVIKGRELNGEILSKIFRFKGSKHSLKTKYNNIQKEMTKYFKGSDMLVKHYNDIKNLACNENTNFANVPI